MSKKILSIILAVMMLISVCAISASAYTAPSSGTLGFLVTSDAKVGQKDGQVTVTVSWVYPADTDFDTFLQSIGNVILGFNSTKYSYVEGSRTFLGHLVSLGLVDTVGSKVTVKADTAKGFMKNIKNAGYTANDIAFGYDTGVQVNMNFGVENDLETTVAKGWSVKSYVEDNKIDIFTLKFNVLGELTANDAIGVVEKSLTFDSAKSAIGVSNGTMQSDATAVICGSAVPESAEAPAVIKAANTTLAGWGNYLADSDIPCGYQHLNADSKAVWCLAVKATFSAADINAEGLSFTDKVSNDIASLNATVKIGDTTLDGNTKFIYDNGDGTYSYYVVLQNLPEDVTDTATITFGGTLVGGGDIKGETVTVDLAAALAAAKLRGMPETAPNAPAGHSAEA